MITKGRDVSSLFPHVAKNVVTKNVELKKLVYMFLVHYAEQEQDAALLAINSFQKDLAASNQYIRGNFNFLYWCFGFLELLFTKLPLYELCPAFELK